MCIRMCYKRARVEQTLGAGEECWPIALLCEERSEELLKRSEDDTFTCVRTCVCVLLRLAMQCILRKCYKEDFHKMNG